MDRKENDRPNANDEEDDEGVDPRANEMREAFLARFLQQMLNGGGDLGDTGTKEALVERLKRSQALTSPSVEQAFLSVPRGAFVTADLKDQAYQDNPLRFAKMGFNISAPHMYAVTLEKCDIEPGMSVLDIGSGCGHWTALAGFLVGPAGISHGLDLHQYIVDFSTDNVTKFCKANPMIDLSHVKFFKRNCFLPDPEERKYDRIHVGACCPEAHLHLLIEMLNPGGILVTPYGDHLLKVKKGMDGKTVKEELMAVRYSDLILPSEAEIKHARVEMAKAKATKIVVPPANLMTEVSGLFNNPKFSDVTFIVGTKKFYAHKFILSLRCEVFRAMFEGYTEKAAHEIPITGQDEMTFGTILKFIYSDQADLTEDNVVGVLECANFYKLERLVALCELHLRDGVDIDSAGTVLMIAERFNAPQLRSFALEFVFSNFQAVMKTQSFKDIDRDLMNSILMEAVKRQSM